jgi:hypothetical protein
MKSGFTRARRHNSQNIPGRVILKPLTRRIEDPALPNLSNGEASVWASHNLLS